MDINLPVFGLKLPLPMDMGQSAKTIDWQALTAGQ